MSRIRTFVAVEIASKVRDRALAVIDRLRGTGADVRWVDPKNLHLTLNFLGDVDEQNIHEVCVAVRDAAKSIASFQFVCHGVDAFPNSRRPRTIWIGVGLGHDEFCELQRATTRALRDLGYPKENRKYHPHLTLGRLRSGSTGTNELCELMKELDEFDAGATAVDEVVVFSSRLESSGPVYEALARCPLGGDD